MNRTVLHLLYFLFMASVSGATIPDKTGCDIVTTFDLALPSSGDHLELPASVNLPVFADIDPHRLRLMRIKGEDMLPVVSQFCDEDTPKIYWMLSEKDRSATTMTYALVDSGIKTPIPRTRVIDDGKTLTLVSGYRPFVTYQYAVMPSPEGVDASYARSGFIHPLYSPQGQVLTRIQPDDHYHHYGIWNPWTHVSFEGKTVDFWNLNKKQGTVRFAGFETVCEGKVFSEIKAKHEHVVFQEDGSEKVALNEIQSIRIYRTDKDYYYADFTIQLSCASKSPVDILEYRYAGFSWRTTEAWNNQNSEIITSEGNTREDADGSNARWCMVQGDIGDDYAGAIMMSSPQNYNHPEPLRVWPVDMYDRGDVFVNFAPTKNRDWHLEPGKTYTLRYRMIVYNNRFTPAVAEAAWQNFAQSIPVAVEE